MLYDDHQLGTGNGAGLTKQEEGGDEDVGVWQPSCHEERHCYFQNFRRDLKLCRILTETDYESGKCPFFKSRESDKSGDYGTKKDCQ